MYTSYFGLREKPFAIAPNPKYLFMSNAHREALAHLVYGINGEGCISLLTGNIGTGKTTVCRCLIEQSPRNTDIAIILNPKLSIEELLITICEELGVSVDHLIPSVKSYTDEINKYLLSSHAKGRNTALIIDEAQNLDIEILEHLRLLTNLETNTKKLLQIVLIGQPELRNILEHPNLEQVNQRITARFHLGPLETESVIRYVQHRIQVAGGARTQKLFDIKSLHHLAAISKGVPRVINLLCDRALLGAYAENKDQVTLPILKKAIQELKTGPAKKSNPTRKALLTILITLLILLIPSTLYYFSKTTTVTQGNQETMLGEDSEENHQEGSITTPPESLDISKIKIHPLINEATKSQIDTDRTQDSSSQLQE